MSMTSLIFLDEPIHEALKEWVKRVENCFESDSVSTCEFLDIYDEFIQVWFLNKLLFWIDINLSYLSYCDF